MPQPFGVLSGVMELKSLRHRGNAFPGVVLGPVRFVQHNIPDRFLSPAEILQCPRSACSQLWLASHCYSASAPPWGPGGLRPPSAHLAWSSRWQLSQEYQCRRERVKAFPWGTAGLELRWMSLQVVHSPASRRSIRLREHTQIQTLRRTG